MVTVIKRNGATEAFDVDKIIYAVEKAGANSFIAEDIGYSVLHSLEDREQVSVDHIHKTVEDYIIYANYNDVARNYISYRAANGPDIFRKRTSIKPAEYPELLKYVDAVRHSYWVHDEFDYTSDIQDMMINLSEEDKSIVTRAMLAISQIENTVKMFWGNVYHHMPKPEIASVGATFSDSECYSEDTEVLTSEGFKLFSDLTEQDLVAAYSREGEVSFEKPYELVGKHYKGILHVYKDSNISLKVTPEHGLITIHPMSGNFKLSPSFSGRWGRNYRYPNAGLKKEGNKKFSSIDALLVAIQADGSLFGTCPSGKGRRDVCFSLKKEAKIQRIRNLLDQSGIEYKCRVDEGGFTKFNFSLRGVVSEDTYLGIKDFSYIDLDEIDSLWGKDFIEELTHWDCSPLDNGAAYYNVRENAIDKVQEICSLSGYRSGKSINRTAEESLKTPNPDGTKRK